MQTPRAVPPRATLPLDSHETECFQLQGMPWLGQRQSRTASCNLAQATQCRRRSSPIPPLLPPATPPPHTPSYSRSLRHTIRRCRSTLLCPLQPPSALPCPTACRINWRRIRRRRHTSPYLPLPHRVVTSRSSCHQRRIHRPPHMSSHHLLLHLAWGGCRILRSSLRCWTTRRRRRSTASLCRQRFRRRRFQDQSRTSSIIIMHHHHHHQPTIWQPILPR